MEGIDTSLESIGEYFRSLQQVKNNWYILIEFPDNWVVYPSEDRRINVSDYKLKNGEEKREDIKKYWFSGSNPSVKVSEIVALINETIALNIEAIKKMGLYQEKVEELKEIFRRVEYSYEVLLNLKFTINGSEVKTDDESQEESPKQDESTSNILETIGEPVPNIEVAPIKKPKRTSKKASPEVKASDANCVDEGVTADKLTKNELEDLRG